ncbi:hypothetical protein OLK001_22290 [Synechocystis sp. LKSZ1]
MIKLTLYCEYPCPCRRRGTLVPIVLTEAFGCNRCQQIFRFDESKQEIELVSSTHPDKRLWYWTGTHWRVPSSPWPRPQELSLILLGFLLLGSGLFLALRASLTLSVILGIIISGSLFFGLLYSLWLVYRR